MGEIEAVEQFSEGAHNPVKMALSPIFARGAAPCR
jgi:hypothetical protein